MMTWYLLLLIKPWTVKLKKDIIATLCLKSNFQRYFFTTGTILMNEGRKKKEKRKNDLTFNAIIVLGILLYSTEKF